MVRKQIKKKRKIKEKLSFLFAFCILLFALSCTHRSSSNWQLEQMHASALQHSSSKLTYYTQDKIHGIDLEFLNTEEGLTCYLNVHSVRLSKEVQGSFFIDNQQYPLEAYVRQGGQKLIVSEKTCHFLVETLLSEKEVEIRLPGYRAFIPSEGFKEKFEKMEDFDHLRNPFHSPF